jgi:photoactive yellow protein
MSSESTAVITPAVSDARPDFGARDILDWLENATTEDLDTLTFGVVGMAADGTVERYNATEANFAGLTRSRVIGRNFFTSVAPCTNNFMVAHRFETEPEIDTVIDYVFTFRFAPKAVRLRLLKRAVNRMMFLLVTTTP